MPRETVVNRRQFLVRAVRSASAIVLAPMLARAVEPDASIFSHGCDWAVADLGNTHPIYQFEPLGFNDLPYWKYCEAWWGRSLTGDEVLAFHQHQAGLYGISDQVDLVPG